MSRRRRRDRRCTGETYKKVVKTTFAKGASLEDPSGLVNSSLEGNVRRAIDFHEGEEIDEKAFEDLVRAAVAPHESPVAVAAVRRAVCLICRPSLLPSSP